MGRFFCYLLFFKLFVDSNLDVSFEPYKIIWIGGIPSKVQIFTWLVALGKVNTCDLLQRRSPKGCLSPNWCVLCKEEGETLLDFIITLPILWFCV